jgi:hypothetical protein
MSTKTGKAKTKAEPNQQTPKGNSTQDNKKGTGLKKGTCDMPTKVGRRGVTVGVKTKYPIVKHRHFQEALPSTPDVAHIREASIFLGRYVKLDPTIFKVEDLALSLTQLESLKLRSRATKGQITSDVVNIIANPSYLLLAQNKLAKGSALGIDNVLRNGLTQKAFQKLAEELRTGAYRPKPNKRVMIPKPDGSKRPLGISNTRDKVVQSALKTALVIIYDPIFSEHSHGFRQGRSCHSALKEIQQK